MKAENLTPESNRQKRIGKGRHPQKISDVLSGRNTKPPPLDLNGSYFFNFLLYFIPLMR